MDKKIAELEKRIDHLERLYAKRVGVSDEERYIDQVVATLRRDPNAYRKNRRKERVCTK